MNIAVVIPVFNESKIINIILSNPGFTKYTVIVVDDCSTIPVALTRTDYPLYLITHSKNLGQGAALQTGMDFCKSIGVNILVHFDGDGQHQVADIPKLVQPLLNKEADMVIGSRFLNKTQPGNSSTIPYGKLIILKLARIIQFIFTGIVLTDSQNGLRALNENALKRINIKQNRMAHAIELIKCAVQKNLVIKEIPVDILYTSYSLGKGQKTYNGLLICIRLLLERFRLILAGLSIIVIAAYIAQVKMFVSLGEFYYTLASVMLLSVLIVWYNRREKLNQEKTSAIREFALKNVQEINNRIIV